MTSKSILITGCSTGIGLHAAKALHERGYRVFATARQQKDVAALTEAGLESLPLDLDNAESIEACFKLILEKTGGTLDYLFNNGAYGQAGAVEDLSTDVLRQQFETNVFGWHHLTRLAIKVMRQQGHGRIVQNSSVLGVVCMPYRGAYNASKYAIEGLTDTLRLELSDSPIHISLLEPGPITSNFRKTAALKFRQNIDWENSYHTENYQLQLERLEKKGATTAFTLGPEAVTKCLLHALESKRPKLRYRITFPTKLFAVLKRLLSARAMDRILTKG
ncbi:SDR family oxidoreductase [Aliikangiella coralliicola]|uniref:SDR family oxidoreductase n=1 Tax=Aliikangiella coralliicola TaxID=2592383 RepID=A0A545UCU7_9GAMM|nr:SDR family oxidoreductase [Aliikangiella coralliicola]TQV87289.1 SDR family oxidoreductase [Aliikangiella coralliicola]